MKRVFAYKTHEYQADGIKQTIEQGEAALVPDAIADRLVAANSTKLMILMDGEDLPEITPNNKYVTTVKLRPEYDRSMVPGGRLSPQKKELLRMARRRSRNAYLTVKP